MRKVSSEEFQAKLDDIYGKGYFQLRSEYINNETKVDIYCSKCKNIFQKRPSKMTGKTKEGCYICSGKNKFKDTDFLQKELNKKYPQKFKLLENYSGARTPLMVLNMSCGHKYKSSPDNLLRGKGCPWCTHKFSSYMQETENILDDMGIDFIKEYRFEECKLKKSLPFDYYISSQNTCIEVDGQFHYKPLYIKWGMEEEYDKIVHRDALKSNFCASKGIKLIRLPYYELKNFKAILSKELQVNTELTV